MQTPAHPDDETNALFALFTHGMGLRSIDLQTTRGDGGQNEIGPELFRDMAVLRTSELLSAHRLDGAEQYFTRAIDYGYSFDPQEVIDKWGRKEIVGDYVRLIRTLRPDVIVTMNIQGRGGDRAHEATTVLVREGYRAAGDPTQYPEQIREGLRPWQPKKLYFTAGFGGPGGPADAAVDVEPPACSPPANPAPQYPGQDHAGQHRGLRSAARPHLRRNRHRRAQQSTSARAWAWPAPARAAGRAAGAADGGAAAATNLMETTIPGQKDKTETSLFDGIDISLTGLAQYAGPNPPEPLTAGLAAILDEAKRAEAAFDAGNDAGVAAPVEAGLAALRTLRAQLASLGLSESARYEIDFRLKQKERDYEDAVLAAHGLTFDARGRRRPGGRRTADQARIAGHQSRRVRGRRDRRRHRRLRFARRLRARRPSRRMPSFTCAIDAHIPKDAKPTTPYFHDDYWKHPANQAIKIFDPDVPFGVPFAPTPFRVTFHVKAGSVEVTRSCRSSSAT